MEASVAIKVVVYTNGDPSKDEKVQLDWGGETVYTDSQGEAHFPNVPTGNRTVYVNGRTKINGVYKADGVYRIYL